MPSWSARSSTLIRPSTSQRLAVDPDDLGLLVGVELVRQVADQRTEQVLDRDDALDAAVLVDHHREGPALAPHLGQHVEDQPRLGHQEWLAQPPRDVDRDRESVRPSSVDATVQPARNRSLTKSTPIRSSRFSPHTGKQLWPDSRTAFDTASTVSGMVSATTSTRGVMTSRTTVSRRSCRASMMNCSWASAPPSTGRPGPSGPPVAWAGSRRRGPAARGSLGLVFVATEHGQRGDPVCSGWGRQAPEARGAATTDSGA